MPSSVFFAINASLTIKICPAEIKYSKFSFFLVNLRSYVTVERFEKFSLDFSMPLSTQGRVVQSLFKLRQTQMRILISVL